ncbi:MAG: PAS domain S-box protein, partial [Kiritimatiellae bacterium]|nr:PAS domain S-box protein [Kiritimatiellia bacterium]
MDMIILTLAVLLQLAAAVLALRLIPITRRRGAWVALSAAMLLMCLRRGIPLMCLVAGLHIDLSRSAEIIALLSSALMVVGLARIRPYFLSIRRSEEAVRESEARYRAVFETTGTAMLIVEEDMSVSLANAEFERLSGYSREEMLGQSTTRLVHPDDIPWMTELHRQRLIDRRTTPVAYDFRFITKDRREGIAHITIDLIPGTRKSVASVMDVTEQRRAEAALRESEKRYREVVETAAEMIFTTDESGNYQWANRAALERTGFTLEEIQRLNYMDLVLPEYRRRMQIHYMRQYARRIPSTFYEFPFRAAGGEVVWFSQNASLTKEGECITGFHFIARDITERKRAQEALREERRLFMGGPTMVFKWRAAESWPVEYVSPNVRNELGYEPDDLLSGRVNYAQAIHPDDLARVVEEVRAYSASGAASFEQEYRVAHADGSYRWLYDFTVPVRDETGEVTHYHGYVLDITERKRAERALREQEARYRTLVETAPDGIAIAVDERVVFVNTAGAHMLGINDPATMIGRPMTDFIAPQGMDVFREHYSRLWERKDAPTLTEEILLRADGTTVPVEAAATVFTFKDKPAIQVVFRDISERKRTQQALKEGELFLTGVFASVQDGISVLDNDLRILQVNPTMERWYAHAMPLVGKKCYEAYHGRTTPCELCPSSRTLETGEVACEAVPLTGPGGAINGWLDLYSYPLVDLQTGQRRGVIEYVRDITERRRAEERERNLQARLTRAERMESLGVLAGGVAHDLNNILGPIVAYPDLILQDLPADSTVRADVLEMQVAAQRAGVIIQDLLTLARRGSYHTEPVSLNAVIESYLHSASMKDLKLRHPNVVLETRPDTRTEPIMGSVPHLTQVLMNLVINAFEAMPHGGHVTISTMPETLPRPYTGYEKIEEGPYSVLCVEDTGPGIPPQDIEHIFEPFFTRKELSHSGSGLGLSVVYGVTKDLHGYVDIRSSLGHGTRFALYFPIAAAMQLPGEEPHRDYRGTETILVVDDIPSQLTLAVRLLSSLGYGVVVRSNGRAALDFLARNPVALVVLDMIMEEGFDGLDTYREILRVRPGQRCIIASGFSESRRVRDALDLGAGAFLRKPYTIDKLGRAVRE